MLWACTFLTNMPYMYVLFPILYYLNKNYLAKTEDNQHYMSRQSQSVNRIQVPYLDSFTD